MGIAYNPKIVTDGLVLALDAANIKSFLTEVEYLIVGGGGGGGGGVRFAGGGGGGGGGGVLSGTTAVTFKQTYSVVVGDGGTSAGNVNGTNGGSSSFNNITALGGGGGGKAAGNTVGLSGGSGGGSGGTTSGTSTAGLGTPGQGNDGGAGSVAGNYNGGGGGGAGQAGEAGTNNSYGGDGVISTISGSSVYYGGGGAGGTYQTSGTRLGGQGGGGDSGLTDGSSGTVNTGGGGGGSGIDNNSATVYTPGQGGSGIVIIRYPGTQKATGGTITSSGGYTIHTFTSSGTFTITTITNWTDVSGNGNNGTLTNGPTFDGANGGSIVFDGSNDQIVVNNSSTYNNDQSKTIEMYVNVGNINGNFVILVTNRGAGDQFVNFSMGIDDRKVVRSWNPNGTDDMVLWYYVGNGTNSFFTFSKEKFGITNGDNTWHQAVGVTDISQDKIFLYYDSQLVHSTTITGTISTPSQNLRFGSGYTSGGVDYPLLGKIASCKIYNRALTAAEISQNFNALRGRYGI